MSLATFNAARVGQQRCDLVPVWLFGCGKAGRLRGFLVQDCPAWKFSRSSRSQRFRPAGHPSPVTRRVRLIRPLSRPHPSGAVPGCTLTTPW